MSVDPVGASLPGAAPSDIQILGIAAFYDYLDALPDSESQPGAWPYSPAHITNALLECINTVVGAALEAGPSEPTVVNPASGVTIPMRDGWVWACARLQLLEGALRGNAATLEVWRAEESVRGGSLPPQVDTPKSTLWEREMRPPLPNEAGILAAIQRVLDSHEAQSPRAILNAIRGVGSRGQEP